MLRLLRTTASHPDFKALVHLLDADLKQRDGEDHTFYHQFNSIDMIRQAVVAYVDNIPAACGAFKAYEPATAEVKRMYVLPKYRRQGLARQVLGELECWAQELQYTRLILETGKAQPEAIALYTRCGYTRIPNYGQYQGVPNSVCLQKMLPLP